jgi:hypothetical protein
MSKDNHDSELVDLSEQSTRTNETRAKKVRTNRTTRLRRLHLRAELRILAVPLTAGSMISMGSTALRWNGEAV